jgi:Na+-transporting NADH:ubiquinone oxidoreductase subunit C
VSDFRVFRFAIIICLACSLLVSGAAIGLRDRQEANLVLDMRKNILKSVGLMEPDLTQDQVNSIYDQRIVGLVLREDGSVVEGRNPSDVDPAREPELMTVFQRVDDGEVTAYTLPIEGKGLWSTLYGYLALDADLDTVRGITFYKHGETPGLGGEIEKDWFQENFVGKKIREGDEIVSVTVVKGHAADKYPDPEQLEHHVDGISGATITSQGVTRMLKSGLERYQPYFERVRNG